MKKLSIVIAFVFLSMSHKATSQVDLGIIGGINSSSLQIEPSGDFDVEGRTTFGVGLFLNLQANDFIGLQVTPMFLQKGANAKIDFDFIDYTE